MSYNKIDFELFLHSLLKFSQVRMRDLKEKLKFSKINLIEN